MVLVCLLLPSPAASQIRTGDESAPRLKQLGFDLAAGAAVAGLAAGLDQIENEPYEWEKTWEGFGKRVLSQEARLAVQATLANGVALALREPVGYLPCRCDGGAKRFGWAVLGAVTNPHPGGRRRLGIGKLVGAFGASYLQTTWTPGHRDQAEKTLTGGVLSLGVDALFNVILEHTAKP